jgi:tetratricopeptide (TPR) repeat protein
VVRQSVAIGLFCACWLAAIGCDRGAPSKSPGQPSAQPTKAAPPKTVADRRQNADVFAYVSGLLNGLGEFDSAISQTDDIYRLNAAALRILERGVPSTLLSQLNQWSRLQQPLAGWQREPLLDTLPVELGELPQVTGIDSLTFVPTDGIELRQAVWLRDISTWAAGEAHDDLERASRLFDWLIRNIQLDADDEAVSYRLPWQTLLLGHGTAEERAWLFTLLARQQRLTVVVLALPTGADKPLRFWLPALLHEGELYLFDTAMGLPIAAADGESVAALSAVADDDALLRQLDLDAEHPYAVQSKDAAGVIALVEASPTYLAQRMALLESRLSGKEKLVLSVNATALAEQARACRGVADARLWLLPHQRQASMGSLNREERQQMAIDFEPFALPFLEAANKKAGFTPALWKARDLHLLGKLAGHDGAARYYQLARIADSEIGRFNDAKRGDIVPDDPDPNAIVPGWVRFITEVQEFDRETKRHFEVNQPGPSEIERWRKAAALYMDTARFTKQLASYWLGLLAYERGDYATAIDYLERRTLAVWPNGAVAGGAWYNLGRAYEAQGDIEQAIASYERDESPQRHGNRLRARRLKANQGNASP